MKTVKPAIAGTVSALPLLELPGQELTAEKAQKARRAAMFDLDAAERSYYDIANGSTKASYGTNTAVAQAMVKSAALSLEGVIRDVERWTADGTTHNLGKLIRALKHANKEADELAASRDVQLERWSLSEVGPNIFVGHLFHELTELQQRFGELFEAIGRSRLEQLARSWRSEPGTADEAKELFTQLSKLLTEGHRLEAHVLWHLKPEGEGLTPMETIFPYKPRDKFGETETAAAYRKHLDAENLLADGRYPEAIAALQASARHALGAAADSPNLGHAMIYLADALLLTGLDGKNMRGGFDVAELYRCGVLRLRERMKPEDDGFQRLVAHVHAQLHDAGKLEEATQLTRDALGPAQVPAPNAADLLRATITPGAV